MKTPPPCAVVLLVVGFAGCFSAGCKRRLLIDAAPGRGAAPAGEQHADDETRALAARLQPARDPVAEAIDAYRQEVRQAYNARRFDDLERRAAPRRGD